MNLRLLYKIRPSLVNEYLTLDFLSENMQDVHYRPALGARQNLGTDHVPPNDPAAAGLKIIKSTTPTKGILWAQKTNASDLHPIRWSTIQKLVCSIALNLLPSLTPSAPSSTSDKTSFAYISARDRWPIIIVRNSSIIMDQANCRLVQLTMFIAQYQK